MEEHERLREAWDTYTTMFPVKKELGSIRKKKVMLEDVLAGILMITGSKHVESLHSTPSYEQKHWVSEGFAISWAFARFSIPSLIVSTKTETMWKTLRNELRIMNLVR